MPFAISTILRAAASRSAKGCRRRSCLYALLLCFFFLVFGTLQLRLFDVRLSMVRIVGGLILMKIGFELFSPSSSGGIAGPAADANGTDGAFVPLAMPLMFGPGAIATILGMTATTRKSSNEPCLLHGHRRCDRRHNAGHLPMSCLCSEADAGLGPLVHHKRLFFMGRRTGTDPRA
ncbi:MarC family protein [Bradyrhizobium sp. Cp5.3]|uniref:MarC family protein n=1 Tax=Bradyrhizobium sp. Cp5.3 TaxID=443598 RepID=UPI0006853325|nr:MarC family protein [Bradyrhizobium sp. Cp5.3]